MTQVESHGDDKYPGSNFKPAWRISFAMTTFQKVVCTASRKTSKNTPDPDCIRRNQVIFYTEQRAITIIIGNGKRSASSF